VQYPIIVPEARKCLNGTLIFEGGAIVKGTAVTVSQNVGGGRKTRSWLGRRLFDVKKNGALLLLTMPFVLYTVLFSYVPMFGAVLAFKRLMFNKGFLGSPWVGWNNFKFFFTSPDAWRVTRNTVGYNAVFIITGLVAAVAVALLLFELTNKPLKKVYQTIMFIPYFFSWVVVAFMAYAFLNSRSGLLNIFLKSIGLPALDWYNNPAPWVAIFPVINLWKSVGMSAIIYYAALVGIEPAYFEAARIEGANRLQVARYVTLPFLYPLITILTILAIGSIFSADFGLFYQLPMNNSILYPTTDVIDTYVYRALINLGNVGMSTAVGLYKSLVGFVLVVASNAIVKKYAPENSLF
jgi:putative aldouronate transport system permease protein